VINFISIEKEPVVEKKDPPKQILKALPRRHQETDYVQY